MTTPPAAQSVRFDRQTAARLQRVIREFAISEVGGRAMAAGGLLLALLLAINALNVVNSYVGRNFMTAIERRDSHAFANQALFYAAVFAASTLAAVIYRFVEERLALLWRDWLTRRLTGFYLDRHFYYHLSVAGGLGNPDQRIADDVRAFTTSTLSLALVLLNGTFTMIAFSGVLWSISRALFATAVIYAALGSAIAYLVGRPLVRLNYDQSDRDADFRAQLVHVRENAESIALLGSEPHLAHRLGEQVGALVGNMKRIIAVNRNLGLFTTGYNYMIQLIPALVVAPLFIRGSAEFGVIPQSSMAFAQLIGAFSLVVNQFPQLSSYAAVLARLNALGEAFQTSGAPDGADIAIGHDTPRLAFEQLTLLAPQDERPLVRGLSLEVAAGARVLVASPDHLVTAALLLAMAGLWQAGSGRLLRPPAGELLMLPERPYLPPGSLREWLVREGAAPMGDEPIWDALRRAGADAAVRRAGGLDVERPWNAVLSLDEQRLVEVARLLLAAPRFVVLAHPATNLGPERAADVLAALAERKVGYIVLGNGELSPSQFDVVLAIASDGTWASAAPPNQPV
jgi:vitamin B12/bleomycin/antimicrobial peptide transport system ATP-binding/permease protein